MGRASKRKKNAHVSDSDIHARITAEAQKIKNAPEFGFGREGDSPELESLLQSARKAIGDGLPVSFTFEGREYWCRVSIGLARLNVFASPATAEPLVTAFFGSSDDFGHRPFH